DYVLDHDHAALAAWVGAARFDFEPFVCKDDAEDKPKKQPAKDSRPRPKPTTEAEDTAVPLQQVKVVKKSRKAGADGPPPELPRAQPTELQKRLRDLEKRFLDLAGGPDDPQRQGLWPEMALLNTALKNGSDAVVCWVNALWHDHAEAPRWARAWAASYA